jgi:cytochrome c oxidase cbb3-type subunit I/II
MDDPRLTSPGSIMPRYSWLLTQKLDTNSLPARLAALRKTGVPYPAGFENSDAEKELWSQAAKVVTNLKQGSITNAPADTEIIALIAYLQRLGADIKAAPSTQVPAPAPKTASVETGEARN